jgi:hypothetical protein
MAQRSTSPDSDARVSRGGRPSSWRRALLTASCGGLLVTGAAEPALAIPQFARQWGLRCTECHVVPPKLNARGQAFVARGYRPPPEVDRAKLTTWLISVWLTGRHEEQLSRDFDRTFVPRVELISGGPIADLPLAYFVEWRVVSLETRADGSLRDRGGRFEDLYVTWEARDGHALTVGQFRSLNQYDVSLRLSVTEPSVLSVSLPDDCTSGSRVCSLRAFAPAGRSPGFAYAYRSIRRASPSDGLFHFIGLPFVGELSLPLSGEARREASFELQGPPKGVFLETFYRQRLNSVGAHAFIDDDRWLLTGMGRVALDHVYATAAVGHDRVEGRPSRMRYSLELEYLPEWYESVRPGLGSRIEHVTNSGADPAFSPYLVVGSPNTSVTMLLQVQYRLQKSNDAVFLDLSLIF